MPWVQEMASEAQEIAIRLSAKHCPAAVEAVSPPAVGSVSGVPQELPDRGALRSRHWSGVAPLTYAYSIQTRSPGARTAQAAPRPREQHVVDPAAWVTLLSVSALGAPPPSESSTSQRLMGSFA